MSDEYDIIVLKKATVVYCASCKQDPRTPEKEVCNYCLLAEVHRSNEDPEKIHEEH
jgi:hypothetical protein